MHGVAEAIAADEEVAIDVRDRPIGDEEGVAVAMRDDAAGDEIGIAGASGGCGGRWRIGRSCLLWRSFGRTRGCSGGGWRPLLFRIRFLIWLLVCFLIGQLVTAAVGLFDFAALRELADDPREKAAPEMLESHAVRDFADAGGFRKAREMREDVSGLDVLFSRLGRGLEFAKFFHRRGGKATDRLAEIGARGKGG